MNDLRELAIEWDIDPELLIQAVESAQRTRRYQESQRPLIASALPSTCRRQLEKARKAIKALPLRAKVHLHWRLAERIAYGRSGLTTEQIRQGVKNPWNPYDLNAEQVRQLMECDDLVGMVLDALSEPLDSEPEDPNQELKWLVQAWHRKNTSRHRLGRFRDHDASQTRALLLHGGSGQFTGARKVRRQDRPNRSRSATNRPGDTR